MRLTRRTLTFGIAGLGAAGLVAPRASAQTGPEQELYAAAKKEGQLTWYSGFLNQPICDSIGAAFTQKYPGVRVNATKTTSEVAFQRVMQDINGGAVQSDVFGTTDASHMSYLISKDKLVKYTPPDAAGLVPALRDFNGGGYYRPGWVALVAIMYNTRKVTAEESPTDWMDLTDAKWKNRIAFGSPNFSGLVAVWTVGMNEKFGWEFFEKLNKLNPLIGRSIDDAVAMLNSGERQVAICDPASALRSIAKGNPLAVNYAKSFSLVDFCPVAILKDSRSPNAAKLFVNFIAGPEYSQILVKNFGLPLRPEVPPPHGAKSLSELTLFQPKLEDIEKNLPGLKNKWRDTFGA
ncbi:MAG TPA: extracellular solute-binding protein [Acetobacteraceae bacterium]|nr:extracellular solute-binding protein [Acetobacteraceae bacterium]